MHRQRANLAPWVQLRVVSRRLDPKSLANLKLAKCIRTFAGV